MRFFVKFFLLKRIQILFLVLWCYNDANQCFALLVVHSLVKGSVYMIYAVVAFV